MKTKVWILKNLLRLTFSPLESSQHKFQLDSHSAISSPLHVLILQTWGCSHHWSGKGRKREDLAQFCWHQVDMFITAGREVSYLCNMAILPVTRPTLQLMEIWLTIWSIPFSLCWGAGPTSPTVTRLHSALQQCLANIPLQDIKGLDVVQLPPYSLQASWYYYEEPKFLSCVGKIEFCHTTVKGQDLPGVCWEGRGREMAQLGGESCKYLHGDRNWEGRNNMIPNHHHQPCSSPLQPVTSNILSIFHLPSFPSSQPWNTTTAHSYWERSNSVEVFSVGKVLPQPAWDTDMEWRIKTQIQADTSW